uniref:G_PROTEIN_RECEP_F1_2 domain-containing protein n=1 Tax=Haemonchus contortus TaxID=6289 RepID=A0A7I4Y131_HAECO|nr:7TM GPCR domain containing protein [Haemonchus contortus]CDJ95915.1 7TM GPCR domain containing protein [Haemonchus contortus]
MDASNFTAEDFARWLRSGRAEVLENHAWDWEATARGFGISYVTLGTLAIVLNSIFLYSLLARRRKAFSHAFYIMILDFTIIDTIKGVSSILYAIKLLKTDLNSDQSLLSIRVDQYSGVLLRFANLATILNLLSITLNEYVFICYPLRYSTLVTRKRVVLVILCIWIVSSSMTFANMVAGIQNRSLWIDDECTQDANSTASCVHRLQSSSSAHFVYHLGLVVFCVLCLAVTAYSYSILLRVVSGVVKAEMKQTAELETLKERIDDGERRLDDKHVMRRHKYVVVIGTVIGVYSAYLTAYATIQVLQLVNISENSSRFRRRETVYLKYICYLCISLHSLLQPLCYLRMREFRQLLRRALCGRTNQEQHTNDHYYTTNTTKDMLVGKQFV